MRLNVFLLLVIIISLSVSALCLAFFLFQYIDRNFYYQTYVITSETGKVEGNFSVPRHIKKVRNYSTLILFNYLGCTDAMLLRNPYCVDSSQVSCKKSCITLKIVGDYDIVYIGKRCIILRDILRIPSTMCSDLYVSNSKIFPIFVKVLSKNLLCEVSSKIKLDLTELKFDRYLKLSFSVDDFTLKDITINIAGKTLTYKSPYMYLDKLDLISHPSFKVIFNGYYESRPYKLFVSISLNRTRIVSCKSTHINVFANFRSPINESSINYIDTKSPYVVNFSKSIDCGGLSLIDCVNLIVNRVNSFFKYASDEALFGVPDYWQFPDETLRRKMGDCEDWTNLVLSIVLRKFPTSNCYNCIVLLRDGDYHSFLLCEFKGKFYAFDQRIKDECNSLSDLKGRKKIKKILYCFNNRGIVDLEDG